LQLFAGQTFRSLTKSRNFRLFFVGQLVSQAGTWMQSIAITWVVLQITGDGVALGLATAAQFLPVLVLGAWGGVVADRVDRHRFLQLTQAAFLAVALAFTVLSFTDHLGLPAIYLLSLALGTITALDNPARRSLVVEMVVESDVPNAVGLNSALMTGSRVVGPAAAGVLITTVGPEWAFAANAATFVAIIVALAAMRRDELRTTPAVPRRRGQLAEGLRYVWVTPQLRLTFVLMAVVGTLAFEWQVTLPLLAERALDSGPGTYTSLYSFMSAGSVIGALVVARRTDVDARFLARAAVALGVTTGLLSVAPTVPLALMAAVPVGFFTVFLLSGSNAVIQLRADPSKRGRVLALTAVVFLGSTPIGGPIAGAVAEHIGSRAGVGMGALASALVGLWVLRQLRLLADATDPVPADPAPSFREAGDPDPNPVHPASSAIRQLRVSAARGRRWAPVPGRYRP
jgi:MFS family permease